MTGFFRQQEEKLAIRLLTWQYQKRGMALPKHEELRRQAGSLVTDAHRIARERGRNVLSILKELVAGDKQE